MGAIVNSIEFYWNFWWVSIEFNNMKIIADFSKSSFL